MQLRTPAEVDAAVYGPLCRRELAELGAWLDDLATTAALAVPVAAVLPSPGRSPVSLAQMAAELRQLADQTAAWQARTA